MGTKEEAEIAQTKGVEDVEKAKLKEEMTRGGDEDEEEEDIDSRDPPSGWKCGTPSCGVERLAYGKKCPICGFEAGVVEAVGL